MLYNKVKREVNMDHACINQSEIATLKAEVGSLKNENKQIDAWKNRIEDKLDKILWFILGQSVTLIVTVVGGLALYAMVGK